MASTSSGLRLWQTAFLTLRDETLTSPPPSALLALLRDLVLSHPPGALAAAARDLPSHEVTSDVVLLAELASAVSECPGGAETLFKICRLIHDISCKVTLGVNSSSWTVMLNFLDSTLQCSVRDPTILGSYSGSTSAMKVVDEILDILRHVDRAYGRCSSLSESTRLVELLLSIVSCLHAKFLSFYHSNDTKRHNADTGSGNHKCNNLWEMHYIAFSMIEDAFSRMGSSISVNLWQSVLEVLRKVMDFLASKNILIVDNIMSRFYTSLLQCLHLVLTDPKGSLSGHVAGLVATLQMFFTFGLPSRPSWLPATTGSKEKEVNSSNQKAILMESGQNVRVPYIPPHLRRREKTNRHLHDAQNSSDCETSKHGLSSSDSDHSDNDGYTVSRDHCRSSKARAAAIVCIQDLCHAEPKSLTSLWTLLLPENDVLQPRKYQATLMTCLLFDPVLKIRILSASTLAAMLDGHSLTFLQVAEHKGSIKCGSFTTLSSSLGQILMQLHTGILYLVQHETHNGLLASSLKVLMLLISATPYSRMPDELLPTVISSVCTRIRKDLAFKTEHIGLLGTALSCLGAALSISPPSIHVLKVLEEDVSRGLAQNQQESGVVSLLLQFSECGRHPSSSFEALQALRVVSHNYPSVVTRLWENISTSIYQFLELPSSEDSSFEVFTGPWKVIAGRTTGPTTEKCTMAATKALDECLRAASGFKGADDLLECRLQDIQLIADCTRRAKVSSAPSYELDGPEASRGATAECSYASKLWCEVIEKHLPLALLHISPMVRAAALTCFAGMTSSIFSSLGKEKQQFVISSTVTAALNDEVPSVRSAACRAIGVITCFSEIVYSAIVLNEFIRAAEFNSHDPLASVRITASWALANICDSLRHRATKSQLERYKDTTSDSEFISLLVDSALRLTKDGDKVKSNAVRALGNLSRFIRFDCSVPTKNGHRNSLDSDHFAQDVACSSPRSISSVSESTSCMDTQWLERMVQAFVSCVTTGNVKVQWNVCHALSNLFMNDSLKLRNMSWAPAVYSILLLLLRDSTNYKIRIHAAVALAVPASRLDYGSSFSDVIQGLQHILELLGSVQPMTPSSFKYKENFEKQLIVTTLHVLGFASSKDDQALKDFLVKKASFLEEWFKHLCSSSIDSDEQPSTSETPTIDDQDEAISCLSKKVMVSRAIKSLIDIYECGNHNNIARKFDKLVSMIS